MKTSRLLLIALVLVGAGAFIACNDTGTSPITTIPTPTDLTAVSTSNTSVSVRWDQGVSNIYSHIITSMPTSGVGTTKYDTVAAGTTNRAVTGLTTGTEYNFSVVAVHEENKSNAVSINWAPASRFDNGYKVYLSSVTGTNYPSGIVIANPPHTQAIGPGASGKQETDLVFADRGNSVFVLLDPRHTADPVLLDTTRFVRDGNGVVSTSSTGLSDDYRSSPYAASTYTDSIYTVTNATVSNGKILYLRVQDAANNNNYARVYIRKQGNGTLLGDDGDGRKYVQLDVSFQDNKALLYGKANKESKPNADESLR